MKKHIIREVLFYIFVFIVSLFLVFLLRTYVFGVALINGQSMEDTLHHGDKAIFLKILKPEKGDIVVVKTEEGTLLIKRVIATEGDTVEIKEGELYINGKLQVEPYIKEPMNDYDYEKVKVPEGEIYVLGDNRNVSADSRFYGTFSIEEQYEGKIIWK